MSETKEFAFDLSQRVNMPADYLDAKDVQGVIVARASYIGREPSYKIQTVDATMMGEGGALLVRTWRINESVLLSAQPKTKSALSIAIEVDQSGLDSALDKARELNGLVGKVNRKAPARKRSR